MRQPGYRGIGSIQRMADGSQQIMGFEAVGVHFQRLPVRPFGPVQVSAVMRLALL